MSEENTIFQVKLRLLHHHPEIYYKINRISLQVIVDHIASRVVQRSQFFALRLFLHKSL